MRLSRDFSALQVAVAKRFQTASSTVGACVHCFLVLADVLVLVALVVLGRFRLVRLRLRLRLLVPGRYDIGSTALMLVGPSTRIALVLMLLRCVPHEELDGGLQICDSDLQEVRIDVPTDRML